jgi:hypothetical protein
MSKPVVIIMTGKNCGNCRAMRGDGSIEEKQPASNNIDIPPISKKYFWRQDFFQKLLNGGESFVQNSQQKVRVYELYLSDYLNSSFDEVVKNDLTINELNLDNNGKVIKTTYTKSINNDTTIKTTGNTMTVLDISFKTFVNNTIPKCIENWWLIYPNFLYANGDDWDNALNNKENIKFYASYCKTIVKSTNKDGIELYGVSTFNRELLKTVGAEDPLENVKKLLNGSLIIKDPVINNNLTVSSNSDFIPYTRKNSIPEIPVENRNFSCRIISGSEYEQ